MTFEYVFLVPLVFWWLYLQEFCEILPPLRLFISWVVVGSLIEVGMMLIKGFGLPREFLFRS